MLNDYHYKKLLETVLGVSVDYVGINYYDAPFIRYYSGGEFVDIDKKILKEFCLVYLDSENLFYNDNTYESIITATYHAIEKN